MKRRRRRSPVVAPTGFRFPAEIIMLAVRWCLRYGLSYSRHEGAHVKQLRRLEGRSLTVT